MNVSNAHQPSEPFGTAPTRRAILTVGGGVSLAAFLAACGVGGRPTNMAGLASSTTGGPASRQPHVRITATGATFNPTVELAAGSTATVSWAVEGGATVTGVNPTIRFSREATRHVRMTADDGGSDALGDVITFNLGFNHLDDQGTYNMGARHDKAPQSVTRVENISLLTGLVRFAAARTPLAGSLDFAGCSRLQYIECIYSNVESVDVAACPSLIRLVLERTRLTTLNLNPVAANLRDLRGAAQQGGTLTLTPLDAPMAVLYHFCVRDQMIVNHPTPRQLPVVKERWDWNTNQSGVLTAESSALRSLQTAGNHYTSADLTNQFPARRNGRLDASSNRLTTVNLTGCNGLVTIMLNDNNLNTAAVDGVLSTVASWGSSGRVLDLTLNSRPSAKGAETAAVLTRRGWTVTTTR